MRAGNACGIIVSFIFFLTTPHSALQPPTVVFAKKATIDGDHPTP
jgi:hypothetical protein